MKSACATLSGIKTCFMQYGDGKHHILCLHGWGGSQESWNHLAEKIIKKMDATVITVDLPGFGNSAMPPQEGWHTQQYAEWLEELLQYLKWKEPILVGHSFGGRIIVRFLEKHPHWKQKVILLGAAGIKWPPGIRQRLAQGIKPLAKPLKRIVPKKIWNKVLGKIFGARDWANCPTGLKNTLEKTLNEPCFREDLKKIKNKILLLWGKNDEYTPLKSAKVFKEKLKNATLHVFEDGRHGIHRTHAQECANKIINFLSS